MAREYDLGPLWEQEPKTSGFRLAIPNPTEICQRAITTARKDGDLPNKVVTTLNKLQYVNFVAKITDKLTSDERLWGVDPINDPLFEKIEIRLNSGYNPRSIEWVTLTMDFDYSLDATTLGQHFELAQLTPQITERLEAKGIKGAFHEDDSDGIQSIIVPEQDNSGMVTICTHWKDIESAGVYYKDDAQGYAELGPTISSDDIPVNIIEMMKSLQKFQYIASHTTDTFYEVLKMTPPDIVLSMSEEYEKE